MKTLKFSSSDIAKISSSSVGVLKKAPIMQIIGLKHTSSALKYEKFQVDFDISISGLEGKIDPYNTTYLNPFDPDDIEVSVTFYQGIRKKRLPAYWAIKYIRDKDVPDPTGFQSMGMNNPNISSVEDPEYLKKDNSDTTPWHARIAPPTVGKWEYSITVVLYKGTANEVTLGPTPRKTFFVSPSNNKGYITVIKPERNFRFNDTSEIYYSIGTTAAWLAFPNYNRAAFLYTKYIIDQTSQYLGNHCRLFLTTDKFNIESGRLTRFIDNDAQRRAFDLDDIVEHALRKNVFLQLVLEERLEFVDAEEHVDFGIFYWQERNPYSRINAKPADFWSNTNSKKTYKKKLRYIMARWGYATGIFAFEFMNEPSFTFATEDNNWVTGTLAHDISDWVNEMLHYCKIELNDEHLYTISMLGRSGEFPNLIYEPYLPHPPREEMIRRMDIDFYVDHLYTSSRYQDYEINYLANRAKFRYPDKPFVLSEFGFNNFEDGLRPKMCDPGLYADHFLSRSPFVTNLYDAGEIHYALWASLMSGYAGTCTLWDDYSNHAHWGGQISNLVPLVKFIQGEDMNLANIVSIRNKAPEKIIVCPWDDEIKIYKPCKFVDGKVPIRDEAFYKENLPVSIFNIDVVTSDDNMAEVFALKYTNGHNKNRIIGWVRNNDNWWFNLPHHGDTNPLSLPTCFNLSPQVNPIKKLKITIKNVLCSGKYRIDFYSVYYARALTAGGSPENGGFIGSITADANCGELSFTIPGDLTVLTADNAPCAPDYGFKIKLISPGWNHGTVATSSNKRPVVNPFAISGDGTQIAYRGSNGGALNCFYRSAGSNEWANAVIGPEGERGVKLNGSISRGRNSNQIYYHGADNRLQVAFWDGSGWAHTHLTNWSSIAQNVDGGIGSQATGGRIFYRGADGQLHFYFFESGAWQHSIFPQSFGKRPTKNTNIAVNDNGSLVAYGANDGKLVLIYRDLATGTYLPDYPAHEFVGGMVRVSKCGNSIFYRDSSGRLSQYYHNGVNWNSRVIIVYGSPIFFNGPFDIAPGCDHNDFQVYYRGADGFIHVAYLWSGNYIAGKVLICAEPTSNKCLEGGYIGYGDGIVAYEAASILRPNPLIQAYFYGTCGQ